MRPPDFLIRILARGKMPWATRVKPEENLSISVANMLRQASLEGRLSAVWSHVPNEGKRSIKAACVMKAMGLLPGTPDFFFGWMTGSGMIELKVGKGRMSPNQKDYEAWCDHVWVKHAVCRSLGEVYDTLIAWQVLKPAGAL